MEDAPPPAAPAPDPLPMRTQPEDAVVEMVLVLSRDHGTKLEPSGLHQFVQKINDSVGAYLKKYGTLHPELDLWNDAGFQDIREFVMGFAVPEFAKAFSAATSAGTALDAGTVKTAMIAVMTRRDTEVRCGRATTSFQNKMPDHGEHTPVCRGNRPA